MAAFFLYTRTSPGFLRFSISKVGCHSKNLAATPTAANDFFISKFAPKMFKVFVTCSFFAVINADIRLEAKVDEDDFDFLTDYDVPYNVRADGTEVVDGPDVGKIRYMVPSTFGYKALDDQKQNNNDQFLRSNVDNEANQRDTSIEPAMDMLPCRQPDALNQEEFMSYERGETVYVPIRWNNPHHSECEFNLWTGDMANVASIRSPFACGGGFQDVMYNFTIPMDVPGCDTEDDGCFIQLYGHSVETRTYAICIKFKLEDGPAAATDVEESTGECDDSNSFTTTAFQTPIYYWDSYDTTHVDSDYSGYRGQQSECLSKELQDAITLRSYLGNGGLISQLSDQETQDRNHARDRAKQLVNEQEQQLKQVLQDDQRNIDQEAYQNGNDGEPGVCIDGDLYSIQGNENCDRQYQNTYIPGVQYDVVLSTLMEEKDIYWEPYTPALKDDPFLTPYDELGQYKVNGEPSTVPQENKQNEGESVPFTLADGTQIMVGGSDGDSEGANGGNGNSDGNVEETPEDTDVEDTEETPEGDGIVSNTDESTASEEVPEDTDVEDTEETPDIDTNASTSEDTAQVVPDEDSEGEVPVAATTALSALVSSGTANATKLSSGIFFFGVLVSFLYN